MIARSALASSKLSPFLGAASLIAILFLVVIAGHAEADVGDSDRLGFFPGRPEWITRNLVDGTPIPVCSTDFPEAARNAVARWNTALRIEAFKIEQGVSDCNDIMAPGKGDGWNLEHGVVRVTISLGSLNKARTRYYGHVFSGRYCRTDPDHPTMPRDSRACAMPEHSAGVPRVKGNNEEWRTYYGRFEIIFNPKIYSGDLDAEQPASPTRDLVHDMAHELGHVLGLADYYCDRPGHSDHLPSGRVPGVKPAHKSLMNSWNKIPDYLDPTSWCDPEDGLPTPRDVQDYTTVYTPAAVTELRAETVRDALLVWLSWKQAKVFVESGFEVQRKISSVWHEVASVVPNATFTVVEEKPTEGQQYRVVARTQALPHHETHGHTHSPAEATVGVTVQPHLLLAPTNPHVTGTTVSSLTLAWTPPASTSSTAPMFKVKYTTGADCDASGTEFLPFTPSTSATVAGATDATVPYPISNLKASTQYKLCVRSVREILPGFEYESDWASTTGTTAALPLPTSLTVRDVTDSKAILHWNKATGADGYEAQIDGADVETTLGKDATSYEFTLRSADTAYQLGVAAKRGDQLSAFATLTLLKPPSSITRSTTAHNSVKYTWTDGNSTGSATGAEVKIGASGTRQTADSTEHHTFNNLSGSTEYTFYIRLKNDQGPSAWRTATVTTPAKPDPPAPPVRPRPPQPDPVVTTERVGQRTEYDWQPYGDYEDWSPPDTPGTCYYLAFQRHRYRLAEFETSWRFDAGAWVWRLNPASKRQIGLETGEIVTPWVETAIRHTVTCPDPAQGVSGASAPTAPPAGTLLPGDYVTAWGGEWFAFSVPSDARVQWTNRTVGEQEAMVFSVAGGAEIVIIPSQIAANPPTSDDATLSAIVESFRAETDPAKLPASAQQQTCVEAPARDDARALSLDLDAQWCSVVSSGGELSVRYGADRISLTVPAGRVWLIFAAAQSESAAAAGIWVMERQSKAYVILSPTDGSELERHVPADATGLPALLDAIAASAAPSVYPASDP